MCYRVYTHTLKCDTRPVICDGRNLLVDPYAAPILCVCKPNHHIPSESRCRHHGCCVRTVRHYDCPRRCRKPVIYHMHIQEHVPRSVHFSEHERGASWRDLPIFDGNIFPIRSAPGGSKPYTCPIESVEFRRARDELLEVGRILDHAVLEIDKALYTARKHDKKHRYAHGSCRCEWQKKVENSKEHADNLEVAVEHFEDLWRAWKRYPRSLERRGDRRVGGLEEWRRREGRGSEFEEFDRLNSFYRKDMRVDEMDHVQAKQQTRQAENYHQDYLNLAGEGRRQNTDWHKHERGYKKARSTSDHIQPASGYGKTHYEYTGRCESGQCKDWHVGGRFRPWRRSLH